MSNVTANKAAWQRSTLPRLSTKRLSMRKDGNDGVASTSQCSTPQTQPKTKLTFDGILNGSAAGSSSGSTASVAVTESSTLELFEKPASCEDLPCGTPAINEKEFVEQIHPRSLMDVASGASTSQAVIASSTSASASQAQGAPTVFRCFPRIKAKRVRFYRNGDQYFKGIWYAISAERVRSFQALLADLTRTMTDAVNLPHGVRFIFTLNGSRKLSQLDEFEDGESYVCSSSELYKRVDYENAKEPTWCISVNGSSPTPYMVSSPLKQEPNDFVHPRIITIIRNGVKPRRVVRHLLNKRTARSFLQVIQDITAVVKLDSGAVRKLYSLSGKEVTCLADFFTEDDVFIAYGKEKMSVDDFYVVSEETKRLYSLRPRASRNKPLKRKMPARNESLREDRAGSTLRSIESSRQLPLLLDNMMHIVRLIGDGNTALVYETLCKKTHERKALKVIGRNNVIGKEELIRSEIAIMRRISHEYIVQMHDCWQFEGSYYLSLELITGGDLFEHLCHVRHVNERCAAGLLRCLGSALDYLHTLNIVHRDVKPENLLVYTCPYTGALLLKLADFGLAVQMTGEPLTVICGTPTYVAPEVLAELGYDQKVDMWAAGVILYVLLCGFPPFQSTSGNQEQLFEQILCGRYTFPSPTWDSISYTAKGLIQGLLQLDTEERFSAAQLLECPWIQGLGVVTEEYAKLMEAAVKANVCSEARRTVLEESDVEYFFSRRTSMDELSDCHEDATARNSSFDYIPTHHY